MRLAERSESPAAGGGGVCGAGDGKGAELVGLVPLLWFTDSEASVSSLLDRRTQLALGVLISNHKLEV